MGPDCLTALPDVAAFTALLATQRRALKAVFLDQSVLSGIGNWVADEVRSLCMGVVPCRTHVGLIVIGVVLPARSLVALRARC